ncbi:hypothetical protein CHISP_3224 [Chitinispirillum alkaliphilum]|nr:hypothetical protein CHISP_3224 [Chitinispirillum alkaliphilum]
MRKIALVLALIAVSFVGYGLMACHHDGASSEVVAQQLAEKSEIGQQTCPVMDREIDKDLYVEQDGKRIYVCCQSCVEIVENDFEKYLEVIKESDEEVEVIETAHAAKEHKSAGCCPVRR